MILSDLLDKSVHTPNGASVGVVFATCASAAERGIGGTRDRSSHRPDREPAHRLSYYGYERGTVNAPAVIARTIEWMHRDSYVVPWECVSRVGGDGVILGVMPPRIPLDPTKPMRARRSAQR